MNTALDKTWWALRLTYGLVPIIAGLDKFTNLLTDWTQYLNPLATRIVPVSPELFMRGVGIIEILAGVLVLGVFALDQRATRLGAYVVAAWLGAIALNLITMGAYLDIAVRDVVMSIGALTLAKLTEVRVRAQATRHESRSHASFAQTVATRAS